MSSVIGTEIKITRIYSKAIVIFTTLYEIVYLIS